MEKPAKAQGPLLLAILDGWGEAPAHNDNAITTAHLPNWQRWWQQAPHTLLDCGGLAVGLPEGQMGNSEVGHMHIGAGRIIYQDFTQIERDIQDGHFKDHKAWQHLIQIAKANPGTRIHLLGLLSPGGVHSHEQHFHALLDLLQKEHIDNIDVHAILDGRDTPPRSAMASIDAIENKLLEFKNSAIGSIMGRYYAMDRDNRWERTELAYNALVLGETKYAAQNAKNALLDAYARDESDEFVTPTLCQPRDKTEIRDNDIVVFLNFRSDRARALSRALTQPGFNQFKRQRIVKLALFVTMTNYASDIPAEVVYPPIDLKNSFGEIIANAGLTQLRIAETEKYAHVTYFFNGGRETAFINEERQLIPSKKIATYDLHPEMSAPEVTEQVLLAVLEQRFDVIILNFANADMVGHTGNLNATISAVKCVDQCLGLIWEALRSVDGEMVITADHGNAEHMFDEITQQPHTAHTLSQVPFVYLGRPATIQSGNHSLIDIAPTLLYLLGIKAPAEMTGHSILRWTEK